MNAASLKKLFMPVGFEKNPHVNKLVDCWVSTILDLPHPDKEELEQTSEQCLDRSIVLREALEKIKKKDLQHTLTSICEELDKSLAASHYHLEWDVEVNRWVLQGDEFCKRMNELIRTLE